MNKLVPGVHLPNKASKPIHKPKKKPVKVVYISNPMKVNTSASQFRALVQELTGRDADDLPAPPFLQHFNVDNSQEQVVREQEEKEVHKEAEQAATATLCVDDEDKHNGSDLLPLQDINGYFSPSNFWYESVFHVDGSKV
ncbi:hypothetical protein DCAR_0417374 [Daucus carota subsp. sativus]|uniref:Uncharacterized protein n=1 Tax=Daucus carota subsp. sativus TaxID=79200 RepID=A0A165YD88_DAUCS|nr:PREDICTED: sigma factor binding protein 1, chloroplastic [Daucus carota subsp. sativus]WOG98033.1 hypothetical protein DCAR_0417374 [Daucus carota subsp. sativus]